MQTKHGRPSHPKGILLVGLAIVALFTASHLARIIRNNPQSAPESTAPVTSQRIVALSPSLVEIVYQLGIDDQLVGVSRFSSYPPEAQEKTIVGGYLDLDFEKVVRLRPDKVLLLREQEKLTTRLNQLGIATLSADHASTDGILSSILEIGKAFQQDDKASAIVGDIKERLKRITSNLSQSGDMPRVLISIERDTDIDRPAQLIAAGNAGVHQEYLKMTGAFNAYEGPAAYPSLSREKLIQLNPDVVIELINPERWEELGEDRLREQWRAFSELKAVRNNHLIFLHEHRHLIPGPRFIDTVEAISNSLRALPSP